MNILFLVNAGILSFLGLFLFSAKRDKLTAIFLASNVGLALWNVCIYLTEELLLPGHVNLISKVQLLAAMVFVNGFYWLCSSYPEARKPRRFPLYGNLLLFSLLAAAVLFGDSITRAELEGGRVVYVDNLAGYMAYTAYLCFFCLGSLYHLARKHKHYKGHRTQIRYLFLGIALFVLTAITFDLIFPLLGNYDWLIVGRLSATFPSLFFSYVIIKHSFLDMTVIINRESSWVITCLLVALSFFVVHAQTKGIPTLDFSAMIALGVIWAVCAGQLQQFLLTSAKRKFVRGWYNTEEVISELAERITLDKNREEIFRILESVLDRVFEVENSLTIVAERDEQDSVSSYRTLDRQRRLATHDAFFKSLAQQAGAQFLEQLDEEVAEPLEELGFQPNRRCVVLPFHSPECLEGLIVLGERSSRQPYSDSDLKFFRYLSNFVSGVLYRLTPMEKLEKHYFENKQRLHEAEIQLIRAQKIESIVHATRQCHHEIRTPLNIIRLGIGRIRSLADLEAYKSVASEEINRALEIVEETLTITDVTKASKDRLASINVNEVLTRCAKLVDQSRYTLEVELQEVPSVWGSFSDIQVVITNLLHNAMDAMPDGGQLRLASESTGSEVILRVEDNGKGIPASLRSRVWEPYFSGHATEVGNSTAGRGWGLTIVNRIVTDHLGTINFTSEEGMGTRFTIVLPAEPRREEEEAGEGAVLPFASRRTG